MTTRVNFILQEYSNIKRRKTNNKLSISIFRNYIVETLTKRISIKDRKKLHNIYKKV